MTRVLAALCAAHALRLGRPYRPAPGDRIVRRCDRGIVIERDDGSRAVVVEDESWLSRCGDDPATAGGRWEQEVGDA